jgi:hypothetical protein
MYSRDVGNKSSLPLRPSAFAIWLLGTNAKALRRKEKPLKNLVFPLIPEYDKKRSDGEFGY